MTIPDNLSRRLSDLYTEGDHRFDALARVAGLVPERDFRRRDLRGLRFDDADLAGFDFTGSDLRGTGVRHARKVDAGTALMDALLDADDAAWVVAREPRGQEDRIALTGDLRRAIDRREFELVFQPKVFLKTGTVSAAEALLRWRHPERGLVSPATFVPLLEEADLIEAVTYWTIETAVDRQRALRRRGIDLVIAVNISPSLVGDRDFIANCRRLVEDDRPALCFEISESALVLEPNTIVAHIRDLDAMGIIVAIDDYGTGLSTLGALKNIRARELKIDRSFIVRLDESTSDPLIVRSTIDLAHAMDKQVTAEGVETRAQLALLTVMGCDVAQGFVISRPLPLDELIAFLEANPVIAVTAAEPAGVQAFQKP